MSSTETTEPIPICSETSGESSSERIEDYEYIPRAFGSSADPLPPYYTVWVYNNGRQEITFKCRCGLAELPVSPSPDGVVEWDHELCMWTATLKFDNWPPNIKKPRNE